MPAYFARIINNCRPQPAIGMKVSDIKFELIKYNLTIFEGIKTEHCCHGDIIF